MHIQIGCCELLGSNTKQKGGEQKRQCINKDTN